LGRRAVGRGSDVGGFPSGCRGVRVGGLEKLLFFFLLVFPFRRVGEWRDGWV
jgi:hypothetical protein